MPARGRGSKAGVCGGRGNGSLVGLARHPALLSEAADPLSPRPPGVCCGPDPPLCLFSQATLRPPRALHRLWPSCVGHRPAGHTIPGHPSAQNMPHSGQREVRYVWVSGTGETPNGVTMSRATPSHEPPRVGFHMGARRADPLGPRVCRRGAWGPRAEREPEQQTSAGCLPLV